MMKLKFLPNPEQEEAEEIVPVEYKRGLFGNRLQRELPGGCSDST